MPMPWRPADLLWERWMAAAGRAWAAGRHAEAAELWRAARAGAEAFAGADPRRATGLDALGSLALGAGDRAAARRHWRDALVAWDAALPWVEAMAVVEGARSSSFHARLVARHPGSYPEIVRRRHRRTLAAARAGSEANLGALDGDRAALGEALAARCAAFGPRESGAWAIAARLGMPLAEPPLDRFGACPPRRPDDERRLLAAALLAPVLYAGTPPPASRRRQAAIRPGRVSRPAGRNNMARIRTRP